MDNKILKDSKYFLVTIGILAGSVLLGLLLFFMMCILIVRFIHG